MILGVPRHRSYLLCRGTDIILSNNFLLCKAQIPDLQISSGHQITSWLDKLLLKVIVLKALIIDLQIVTHLPQETDDILLRCQRHYHGIMVWYYHGIRYHGIRYHQNIQTQNISLFYYILKCILSKLRPLTETPNLSSFSNSILFLFAFHPKVVYYFQIYLNKGNITFSLQTFFQIGWWIISSSYLNFLSGHQFQIIT